jgi:hypothetical protein
MRKERLEPQWDHATWYGRLNPENAPYIVERLRRLLTGKLYTMVMDSNTEASWVTPQVLVNQYLTDPKRLLNGAQSVMHFEPKDPNHVHICVYDSYGCWGFSTYSGKPEEKVPYIVFEYSSVTIEHYAPCGNPLRWQIKVQGDKPLLDEWELRDRREQDIKLVHKMARHAAAEASVGASEPDSIQSILMNLPAPSIEEVDAERKRLKMHYPDE